MILAAGRGKRMRPLTDQLPKPLLKAGDRRLIDWSIDSLRGAGIDEVVVNIAHLADTFYPILGESYRGVRIIYSREGATYGESLETLGGIVKALPLLSGDTDEPFIVVAGDIATDFDFSRLVAQRERLLQGQIDAHLVLVPNPDFHLEGDMGLEKGKVTRKVRTHTFSSIGIYSPRIFREEAVRFEKLFPWLYQFIDSGRVSGEIYFGYWNNVGTPLALEDLAKDPAHFGRPV